MSIEATDSTSNNSRGEFVKAGYLVKSPPLSRALVAQWHRRWFLLMDSKLVYPLAERYVRLDYYQSEADAKRLADPKGSINLGTCLAVLAHNEQVKNFRFVFDVSTSDRIYHLAADSEEERMEWVKVLKNLLFPSPPPATVNGHRSKDNSRLQSPEIDRRMRDSQRPQRPLSHSGFVNDNKTSRVQMRPLPPVPDVDSTGVPSSPVERRHRPLPATPLTGVLHVHSSGPRPSSSPSSRKKPLPPVKPIPYRKNNSQPLPPEAHTTTTTTPKPRSTPSFTRSASLSPPNLLGAEDYQEFVSQHINNSSSSQPDMEDNYSLVTSVPLSNAKNGGRSSEINLVVPGSNSSESDYSVLESTVVQGYNMKDDDYSHLGLVMNDSPPPPVRQSSLAQHHHQHQHQHSSAPDNTTKVKKPTPVPRKRVQPRCAVVPDYVNCPNEEDDYSHLHH